MSIHDKYLNGKDKLGIAIERLQTFCKGKRVLCAFSGGSGTLRSPRRASQLLREGSPVHHGKRNVNCHGHGAQVNQTGGRRGMNTILFNDALVIASALCLAGCGVNVDPASAPSRERYFKKSASTFIYSIEIEGHEYIVFDGFRKGGIVHSESCTCKKGGAE